MSGGILGRGADSESRLRISGCRRLLVGSCPQVGFELTFVRPSCWLLQASRGWLPRIAQGESPTRLQASGLFMPLGCQHF